MFRSIFAAMVATFLPGGALAGQADCVPVSEVGDGDFRRHLEELADPAAFCITPISIEENGLSWRFYQVENLAYPRGPRVFLPHDNENAAFDAAIYMLRRYGGRLIAVESGDSRRFQGQDPNRNFGAKAEETASCRDMNVKPAPAFTKLLGNFHGKGNANFYFAMHNNDDGYSGGGGAGTISARRNSSVMHGMMAPGGAWDEDDAVLLAGTAPFEQNSDAMGDASYFLGKGINVIYEHVVPARNDCSFSNYVVLHGLGDYYNIEAQQGHVEQQKRMLDALMSLRGVRAVDKSVK